MHDFSRRMGLGAALLAIPAACIYVPRTFLFPFVAPKVLAVEACAVVAGAALAIHLRGALLPARPIGRAVLGYLAAMVLAGIASIDHHRSAWDSPDRMLGVVATAHFALLFGAVSVLARGESGATWRLGILRTGAFTGAVVAVLAAAQKLDPEFLFNQGNPRVSGPFGQPAYLSAFGLFVTFCGAALMVPGRVRGTRARGHGDRAAAIAGIVAGLACVALGESRASALGLVAGGAVFCGWMTARARTPRARRFAAAALVAIVVTGAGGALLLRHSGGLEGIPLVRRLAAPDRPDRESLDTRRITAAIALESWRERPVFGWGPGTFAYSYYRHYRPVFLEFARSETWFDDAHDVPLNHLAETGIVGLLAYLALFGAAGFTLVRGSRGTGIFADTGAVFPALAAAYLAGHFTQNLFTLESVTSLVGLFIVFGLIDATMSSGAAGTPPAPSPMRARRDVPGTGGRGRLVAGGAGVVAIILVVAGCALPLAAGHAAFRLSVAVQEGRGNALEALDRSLAIPTPWRSAIRELFARAVIDVTPKYIAAGRGDTAAPLIARAIAETRANIAAHPREARYATELGDLAQAEWRVTRRTTGLPAARDALESAVTLAPRRQDLRFLLAAVYGLEGRTDDALAMVQRVIDDAPGQSQGYVRMAEILEGLGRMDEARRVMLEANARQVTYDAHGAEVMRRLTQSP